MAALEASRIERFLWADKRGCGFFQAVSDYNKSNDLHIVSIQ